MILDEGVIAATRADNGGWLVNGEWYGTERAALKRMAVLSARGEKPWPTRMEIIGDEGQWWARTGWGFHGADEVGPFASPIEAAEAMADKLDAAGKHQSDCATHNEPAMPAGPCDCGAAA